MTRNTDPAKIVSRARGDVDRDLLTGTGPGGFIRVGYFSNGPLVDHLEPDECLHYIATNNTKGLQVEQENERRQISPTKDYRTAVLVTDRRVLFIIGQKDDDELLEVPLTRVESACAVTGLLKDKLVVTCEGASYRMYTKKGEETKATAEYITKVAAEARSQTTVKSTTNGETRTDDVGVTSRSICESENQSESPDESVFEFSEPSNLSTSVEINSAAPNETGRSSSTVESSQGKDDGVSNDTIKERFQNPGSVRELLIDATKNQVSLVQALIDTTETSTTAYIIQLPSSNLIASVDEEATQYVNSAYELLKNHRKNNDCEDLVRAHTELCAGLEVLKPTDTAAAGIIQRTTTALEKELETSQNNSSDADERNISPSDISEPTEEREDGSVDCRTGSSVEIHVLDSEGLPVEEAIITLSNDSFQISGETDPSGRYLSSVPTTDDEMIQLSIVHPDFQTASGLVTLDSEQVYGIHLDEKFDEGDRTSTKAPNPDTNADATDGVRRAELIEELETLASKWSKIDGKLLTSVGDYHPKEYIDEFGSVDAALSAAGLNDADAAYNDDNDTSPTEDRLERAIRDVVLENESEEQLYVSKNSVKPAESTTSGGCGRHSYSGDRDRDFGDNQRREKLIAELRELSEKWSDIDRRLLYSVGDNHPDEYADEFGSLEAALNAAKVEEDADSDSDDGRSSVPDIEEPITQDTKSKTSQVSTGADDSQTSAKKDSPEADSNEDSCNIDTSGVSCEEKGLDDEDIQRRKALISELQNLDKKWSDIDRKLLYSVGDAHPDDYIDTFGSLNAALIAAGVVDSTGSITDIQNLAESESDESTSKAEDYTDSEMLEAVRSVSKEVDGSPSIRDMYKFGEMSPAVVCDRFDGWIDALEMAGVADSNDEDKGNGPATNLQESSATAGSSNSKDGDAGENKPSGKPIDSDPLADGLTVPEPGRLSGVRVEVRNVNYECGSRRTAEVEVETSAGEVVMLDLWNKHDVDWSFETGERLQLSQVRLKRWNSGEVASHQLSSTSDFSVTGAGHDTDTEVSESVGSSPVEELTGIGGATESDAESLVAAGYKCREDLESASIDELRNLSELDSGIALRIKAEVE